MRLRRLEIERFRGIKSLDWTVAGDFVCLIGPGDSTKTTILDAIEFVLSPRWNIAFDDTDFYDGDSSQPFCITATVGDVPSDLISNRKFGDHRRGWRTPGTLVDEPGNGDENVLSIRLLVPSSLEPTWVVINDRVPDGVRIRADDREKLGCTRLGEFLDRHFSWARGSIVARLTGKSGSVTGVLAEATRAARDTLAKAPPGSLKAFHDAASEAERLGKALGVAPKGAYRAQLDAMSVSFGSSGLSLHDAEIPVRRSGLGTRRLLAVAIQRHLATAGGLTLVDEIEEGLEPHRLRHLLRELRIGPSGSTGHVVMTSHAPVALGELHAEELRVVRCAGGDTTVRSVDPALQPIIRKASEAFLARSVLVCEGKTELGFCRRLDREWATETRSFALSGIALTDGGGGRTEAPAAARALAELGYRTAYVGDSDQPLNPDEAALRAAGCEVVLWDGGVALEARIAADMPWPGVAEVVQLAMDQHGEEAVRDAIAQRVPLETRALATPPADWITNGLDEAKLRSAIGVAAQKHKRATKSEGWFKRVDLAEELCGVVLKHWDSLAGTDLRQKLEQLRAWAHGN